MAKKKVRKLRGNDEQAKDAVEAAKDAAGINELAKRQREYWHPGVKAW